jgi:hypothetical protein
LPRITSFAIIKLEESANAALPKWPREALVRPKKVTTTVVVNQTPAVSKPEKQSETRFGTSSAENDIQKTQ